MGLESYGPESSGLDSLGLDSLSLESGVFRSRLSGQSKIVVTAALRLARVIPKNSINACRCFTGPHRYILMNLLVPSLRVRSLQVRTNWVPILWVLRLQVRTHWVSIPRFRSLQVPTFRVVRNCCDSSFKVSPSNTLELDKCV